MTHRGLNTQHFHEDRADLEQAVGLTIGAASVCWENMNGTGVFESDRAKELLDQLVDYIERHYEKRERPNCTFCEAGEGQPTLPYFCEDDEPEILRDCGD